MHRAHLATILTLSAATVAGWPGTARADRIIDPFRAPLPQQLLPDGTHYEGLWVGTYNPGAVLQTVDSAAQGLPVLGLQRDTTLTAGNDGGLLWATIFDGTASYASDLSSSGILELEYGAAGDLDADLTKNGELAFELEISGDMDDGAMVRPVFLTIAVTSGSGAGYADATYELVTDGVYQLPFADFAGVDFSDVDHLSFSFDGSGHNAIDFDLIGGLRTTACLQAGPVLADIPLDTFQTPLPDTVLPGYGDFPGLWAGTWNGVEQASALSNLSSVEGVLGGNRWVKVLASDISNFLTAIIDDWDGTPYLSYATGYPTSGSLIFRYPMSQPVDLSSMQAFEFEIEGDMDDSVPLRPIDLDVVVKSGAKTSATTTITVLDDGLYTVPFSAFNGVVDFSNVTLVRFELDSSNVEAIDYTLYGGWRATACVQ